MMFSPVVGAVLGYTGIVKALDVRQAERVLLSHLAVPCHLALPAVAALAGFESALGAALLLQAAPAAVLPVAIAFLLTATGFSLRALRAGHSADCGCYGGLRVPTALSIALNVLYLAALGWDLAHSGSQAGGPLEVALLLGVCVAGVAWLANGKPIVDTAPLRVGRRWRRAWSDLELGEGEHFVVLLRASCPHCKVWVPFVNIFERSNPGITTLGLLPGDAGDAAAFAAEQGASFRLVGVRESIFDAMTLVTPVAVRLRQGRIVELWSGEVPAPLLRGARHYYRSLFPRHAKDYLPL